MTQFIQLTASGLANGAILALAALGFVVIFKATGVVNFAQGQFLLIGAYLIHQFTSGWGWHWTTAVPAAIVVAVLMGMAVERLILRRLVGESIISVIMVTIGLAGVLQAIVLGVWGPQQFRAPAFIPRGTVSVLGASVAINRVVAIAVAAVVFTAFAVFFRRSKQGIAMRAVADDQQAAMVQGISVNRIFAFSWGLAAATAVLGGMLLSQILGVSLEIATFGVIVFPVVILGGLDSIVGTVIGGVIVGLLGQYSAGYIGPGLQQVVPFVILILILLVKPYGLFGQVRIERV
ncbi:MAG: branched-chain amino acid ABC transporter permease [Actinomycetota bacterium]|jgi:branched-chain amino acid transport system permease protein|nr:branched-chain amino acid ABC transporter permease [Actinomycetota bacterium]